MNRTIRPNPTVYSGRLLLAIGFALAFCPVTQIKANEINVPLLMASPSEERTEKRMRLFEKLKAAPSAEAARRIETQIWEFWMRDTDVTSRSLVMDALTSRSNHHFDHALVLLNSAIQRSPTYAEAWNQRAYLYYMLNDDDAALRDIEKTLQLEPKHFGALAGRARIYMRQGRIRAMQQTLRQALRIHPWLNAPKLPSDDEAAEPL